MKHLTILAPDGHPNPITIISTYMAFTQAEKYNQLNGKPPVFDEIVLAGISHKIDVYNGMFSVTPVLQISNIKSTDMVIIPAFLPQTDPIQNIELNQEILNWIQLQYSKGAEVASLCTGAYLLASTGLIEGKKCSIHWKDAATFRNMFPQIDLVADRIITYEKGLYTSGGAFSFMNLILYLIERNYGREMAVLSSKIFQIDIDRSSQSPYIIFNIQKSHNDDIVLKAQAILESNSDEKLSMDQLAQMLAISRRNLDRRFIKATGNTPIEYLLRVKIEATKKQLECSMKTIQEIMYENGYTDLRAFREQFRKITGLTPVEYRKRYCKVFSYN